MKIDIRLARLTDLNKYTDLLQRTYQKTYTNERMGITKDLFSKEIFNSSDTQKYLKSNLETTDNQKTWLAFDGETLIGSITMVNEKSNSELRGFYVDQKYQGKGIGKKLWNLALDFAEANEITLDIYAHNLKTIEIYRKWGFEVDTMKGNFYRHWPEWPKGVKAKCIYMTYDKSSRRDK